MTHTSKIYKVCKAIRESILGPDHVLGPQTPPAAMVYIGGIPFVQRGNCIASVPAGIIFHPDGTSTWRKDGQLHREDGPAMVGADGTIYWFKHGKFHREGGPAIITAAGDLYWFKDGLPQRDGGPAIIKSNGDTSYIAAKYD